MHERASVPFSGPSSLCQQSWCLIGKIIALKAVNGHMCNERDDMIWLHLNLCVAIYLSSHLQIYIYIKYDSIVLLVQSYSNSSTILIMSDPNNHLKYIITLRHASRSSHLRNTSRYRHSHPGDSGGTVLEDGHGLSLLSSNLQWMAEPMMGFLVNDSYDCCGLKDLNRCYPLVMTYL